jgi:hypothetical protein
MIDLLKNLPAVRDAVQKESVKNDQAKEP